MTTDPIADFLTRIRNAQMAGHRIVEIPASNLKKRMTEILYNQGYILKYKFEDDSKQGMIKIALKYDAATKEPAIKTLERVSRPGLRQYSRRHKLNQAAIKKYPGLHKHHFLMSSFFTPHSKISHQFPERSQKKATDL
jgi:ribosomal protein S8